MIAAKVPVLAALLVSDTCVWFLALVRLVAVERRAADEYWHARSHLFFHHLAWHNAALTAAR